MITQEFDLNMIPDSEPVVVHVNQYDIGSGRLIAHLYDKDQSAANTANSAADQAQSTADHIENYVDPHIEQQEEDNAMVYASLEDLWSHLGWTPSHWEPR